MLKIFKQIKEFVFIIIIALIFRFFVLEVYQINGYSMYPNYYNKEFVIVNKLPYKLSVLDYNRGDVIVFNTHISGKEFYIKRIIGLPGEKITFENGEVFITDTKGKTFKLNENYLDEKNKGKTYISGINQKISFDIPKGEYFVMGDNRNGSTDSRDCFYSCTNTRSHFVKIKDIIGKVFLDLGYFNFSTFSFYSNEKNIKTYPKFFNSLDSYKY